jgi:hypothetical protein
VEARMDNGTSVNRVWGDNQEGELVAVFQYARDAEAFARWRIEDDAKAGHGATSFYVLACGYSGKVTVFRQPSPSVHDRPEEK